MIMTTLDDECTGSASRNDHFKPFSDMDSVTLLDLATNLLNIKGLCGVIIL